jgi:hypothetical protein
MVGQADRQAQMADDWKLSPANNCFAPCNQMTSRYCVQQAFMEGNFRQLRKALVILQYPIAARTVLKSVRRPEYVSAKGRVKHLTGALKAPITPKGRDCLYSGSFFYPLYSQES